MHAALAQRSVLLPAASLQGEWEGSETAQGVFVPWDQE